MARAHAKSTAATILLASLAAAALRPTALRPLVPVPLAGRALRHFATVKMSDADAAAPAAAPSADAASTDTTAAEDDPVVQFVVVRRDLLKTMEWPVGSVIAQACHACTAATVAHLDDAHVRAYLADVDHMRKVVKECKGETQLLALADALRAAEVPHKVWLEQPENLPTAIALKPSPRSAVAPLLKKYQLFK